MDTSCSVLLLFLPPLLLLLLLCKKRAGLVVVGSISAWADDAVTHTGLEEPPSLSGYNYGEVTWFQHRGSSTAPAHSGDLAGPSPPRACDRAGVRGASSAAVSAPATGRSRSGAVHPFSALLPGEDEAARIHLPPGRSVFQHGVKIRRPFRPFPAPSPECSEPDLCLPHTSSLGGW